MSSTPITPVDAEVRIVRLLVPDAHGVVRAKAVSADYFRGLGERRHVWAAPVLYGDVWQNLPSDVEVPMGNAFLVPDMDTWTVLPWNPTTAVVICDLEADLGLAPAPRSAARRVLDSVTAAGYTPLLGPEVEFYLLTPEVDGPHGGSAFGMQDWYSNVALSRIDGLVQDLFEFLPRMGIPVYEVFNEHGAGQMEINVAPTTGLRALDQIFLARLATKELAERHGLRATFMSVPSNHAEHPPSGFHLHQTLLDAHGHNLFAGAEGLSALGRAYVGGQLAHASGITGVAAATVTAYKRLRPNAYAPLRAGWGIDNRTAMVRAVLRGESTRIENRLGASDANPYLLAAAQLAAGLDGIATGADPGQPAAHDVGLDPSFPGVPTNLLDGVAAFEADAVLVEALGADVAEMYCAVQRQVWQRYQFHVTEWEIAEYRDVL
jgi:glutamine synthetase